MSNSPNRSFEQIDEDDLRRIGHLAEEAMMKFLTKNETGKHYAPQRFIMACLCQGAAKHFVHRDRGVQDFDVVYFYRRNPAWKFPPRWCGNADFGRSKFGRNPDDGEKYEGRRIDVLARDIKQGSCETPEHAVRRYLTEAKTHSARLWAQRPLVGLSPNSVFASVIWNPS